MAPTPKGGFHYDIIPSWPSFLKHDVPMEKIDKADKNSPKSGYSKGQNEKYEVVSFRFVVVELIVLSNCS